LRPWVSEQGQGQAGEPHHVTGDERSPNPTLSLELDPARLDDHKSASPLAGFVRVRSSGIEDHIALEKLQSELGRWNALQRSGRNAVTSAMTPSTIRRTFKPVSLYSDFPRARRSATAVTASRGIASRIVVRARCSALLTAGRVMSSRPTVSFADQSSASRRTSTARCLGGRCWIAARYTSCSVSRAVTTASGSASLGAAGSSISSGYGCSHGSSG